MAASLLGADALAQTSDAGDSRHVTLTCTSSPCPWGNSLSGSEALVWPASAAATSSHLGYTSSQPVYLSDNHANGANISIVEGTATVRKLFPTDTSSRVVKTLGAGEDYDVSGLAPGEMLLVIGADVFSYEITLPEVAETDPPSEPTDPGTPSEPVVLTCTSSPCPWGQTLTGSHAIIWPASAEPTNSRLGYTTSKPAYLPRDHANGASISIIEGTGFVYAVYPNEIPTRLLATVSAGESFDVTGVAEGEVLLVLGYQSFSHSFVLPDVADPGDPGDPEDPPAPGGPELNSLPIYMTCDSSPCPWGNYLNAGHAIIWPESSQPIRRRMGYLASKPASLPASYANGATVTITSGVVDLYVWYPTSSTHRIIATLSGGDSYTVNGLLPGEVVAALSNSSFTYKLDLPEPPAPAEGVIYNSVDAVWRCDMPGCDADEWSGAVVSWPDWSAHSNNGRSSAFSSRTVYSTDGGLLYPYMGSWADGCVVTVNSGTVWLIEWEHGADDWRTSVLVPGDTHVIDLQDPENGALIEGFYGFSVTIDSCTPELLPEA